MSKIEWTDETWNPVTGCTKIADGCMNCYAERISKRLRGRYGYPANDPFKVTEHWDKLNQPLHWKKPRTIFVCSMGDLFHDLVIEPYIEEIFSVMASCPQHRFLVLTKRPKNMFFFVAKKIRKREFSNWPLPNVGIGVSISTQKDADELIPTLLDTPAAMRFVSAEPLIEEVDLSSYLFCEHCNLSPSPMWGKGAIDDGLSSAAGGMPYQACPNCSEMTKPDWVIMGGESGPKARPMEIEWARKIKEACNLSDTAFFMKQLSSHGHKKKQNNLEDFPEDLRVREIPENFFDRG